MTRFDPHGCFLGRCLAIATATAFLSLCVLPPQTLGQAADDRADAERIFAEADDLISREEFDQAVALLRKVIDDYAGSEQILRDAYNYLVWTYIDCCGKKEAQPYGEQALVRFPDLVADIDRFPEKINNYYDELRDLLFGALSITTEPVGCQVFLDGRLAGETPVDSVLVRTGTHKLKLTKSGYNDRTEEIFVLPGPMSIPYVLEQKRGWKWWAYRVGAGAVALGLLAVGLTSGGDSTPPPPPQPEPLGDPPGPPSRSETPK